MLKFVATVGTILLLAACNTTHSTGYWARADGRPMSDADSLNAYRAYQICEGASYMFFGTSAGTHEGMARERDRQHHQRFNQVPMLGHAAGAAESRQRQHQQRMDEMRFAQAFNRQQTRLRACMAQRGYVWVN